jgi:hypothetical protein
MAPHIILQSPHARSPPARGDSNRSVQTTPLARSAAENSNSGRGAFCHRQRFHARRHAAYPSCCGNSWSVQTAAAPYRLSRQSFNTRPSPKSLINSPCPSEHHREHRRAKLNSSKPPDRQFFSPSAPLARPGIPKNAAPLLTTPWANSQPFTFS